MQDKYIDNTGDKKYFTIIPNYIANHSSANDQALYLQMKKIVGEREGVCYASEKYFKDKLQIGSKALKKSIQYLLDHKWIEYTGLQEVETNGGVQKVKTYLVKDIWQKNIDYYQGVSEREPLTESKGVSESNSRGVQKEAKGVAFEQQIRTYNNNNNNTEDFDLLNEIENLQNHKRIDYNIIGHYLKEKKLEFRTKAQYTTYFKRCLKPANELKIYSPDEIQKIIDYCKKNYTEWTLETISKKSVEIINNNK